MSEWKPDGRLKLLLGWVAFHLIFSWLPLVRCVMDGDTYRWGTAHFGRNFYSSGIQRADVFLLVFKSALFVALLWLGLRGAGRLFHWLIVGWTAVATADMAQAAIRDPGGFEFHGDTLGIHLNLSWIVPPIVGLFFLLAVWWVVDDRKSGRKPVAIPLARTNRVLIAILLALLPVQFVLLRFDGIPATDVVGVLLTIAQAWCWLYAFYPYSAKNPPA